MLWFHYAKSSRIGLISAKCCIYIDQMTGDNHSDGLVACGKSTIWLQTFVLHRAKYECYFRVSIEIYTRAPFYQVNYATLTPLHIHLLITFGSRSPRRTPTIVYAFYFELMDFVKLSELEAIATLEKCLRKMVFLVKLSQSFATVDAFFHSALALRSSFFVFNNFQLQIDD